MGLRNQADHEDTNPPPTEEKPAEGSIHTAVLDRKTHFLVADYEP